MKRNLLTVILTFFVLNIFILPQGKINKPFGQTDTPSSTFLNINNISTYFYNNGISDINPNGDSGFEFPKNSGRTAIFASGLVWGTKIAGDTIPRVGGTAYRTGMQPGIINPDGTAGDLSNPSYRIYRVRSDIYPGGSEIDLTEEAKAEEITSAELRVQYELDWNQWPAYLGAPFEDKNKNGTYEPAVDIPGVNGADQTIWYVANDLDSDKTKYLFGANPIGIEMQVTAWASNREGALGNTQFRKFKLINKSQPAISSSGITYDSMYITLLSDPDLGSATDDYVGTDTLHNFVYVYNGVDIDNVYSPLAPPALAFNLMQGPVIDSPGSTGIFDGRILKDKKNMGMTSSMAFICGNPDFAYPPQGNIEGSIEMYNFMKGKHGLGGKLINPLTNQSTTFYAQGDPITQSGWIEGLTNGCGDRVSLITSGPFNMAPGDTQEVVFAVTIAGGKDRLHSLKLLRFYNAELNSFYHNGLNTTSSLPLITPSLSYDFNGIHLNWDDDQTSVNEVESFNQDEYTFQGYNVYQLADSEYNFKQDGIRLATFDKIDGIKNISGFEMDENSGYAKAGIAQYGNDTGLKRSFLVLRDSITENYLINGKPYYFAVTGYYYNPNKIPATIENILNVVNIKYNEDKPGIKYSDSLNVVHSAGLAEVKNIVYASVYDPQKMNGHTYSVIFANDTITSQNYNYVTLTWSLIDSTDNQVLISKQKNLQGNIFELAAKGIRVGVTVTKGDMTDYHYSFSSNQQTVKANPNSNPITIADITYFGFATGRAKDYFSVGGEQVVDDDLRQDLEFRFTGVRATNSAAPEDTTIISGGSIATLVNKDKSISNRVRIPFELWEVERNRQINVAIYSRNADLNDPWESSGSPLYYRLRGRSYIVPVATNYNANASTTDVNLTSPNATWCLFFTPYSGAYQAHWDSGDEVVVYFTKPLASGDAYSFVTPIYKPAYAEEFIPGEYKLYQNYPNPFNPSTNIRYNVPQKGFVNINVYNILGQRVTSLVNKEIDKGLYQTSFDASSLASGIYVYTLNVDGNFYLAKKMILLK